MKPSYLDNIYFILVEPIYGGNVGAIARILNNFCLSNLRIVGSAPDKNDYYLAMHSEHILTNAQTYSTLKEAIADLDRVIAFSRRIGKTKPVDMNPWTAAEYFHTIPHLKVGFVFGRETFGLTDVEADLCPLRCHIPANPDFPSLNLAQAVALAAWELWSYPVRTLAKEAMPETAAGANIPKAVSKADLDNIRQYMLEVMKAIGFFQDHESTNWESFLSRMLHQLNPSPAMVYRFRQMFNRFHVLFTGKGKGY